jgi:hypothetical protein
MRILTTVFAATILFSGAVRAQDCSLDQLAALPLTTLPSGAITAPFGVNGRPTPLTVALQSTHTGLSAAYAQQIGESGAGPIDLNSLGFGKFSYDHDMVDRLADNADGTAGVMGIDRLRRFDVEFDFKNAKMVLFAKSQCPGPGFVYWTTQYTTVPMHIDADGHVIAQLTLDGRPVNAEISTAPGHLAMRVPANVKALGIGAIALNNPQVTTASNIAPGADVRVGLDELKKLHLFFAFSENKLYVTP